MCQKSLSRVAVILAQSEWFKEVIMANHLVDRALGWAQARIKNSDLDTYPAGLCRRVRLRKTSAGAPLVIGRDTSVEEPNATSAALTLRFLAEYADADPSKVSACRPLAEEIGNWLLAMPVSYTHLRAHET